MSIKEKIRPLLPGIMLFVIMGVVGLSTFRDYGIAWDESMQRHTGEVTMAYVHHGDKGLFTYIDRQYGPGYELLLIIAEKVLHVNDAGHIFQLRHIVSHLFFLMSAFCCYVLALRLFKNRYIALLGFLIYALCPRIYGHSFFNSKDVPYLAMFMLLFLVAEATFREKKRWQYLLLGAICGYTTSVRIMGIMPTGFLGFFLLVDILLAKAQRKAAVTNLLLFAGGYCVITYACWPFLWTDPIHNFIAAYKRMSHFDWPFSVLLNGQMVSGTALPWYYMPEWFVITNPILWLILGLLGTCILIFSFLKAPMKYLANTRERNFLLYLMSLGIPVFAVIFLHAVIYDDWRHLYFIYAPFVLIILYVVDNLYRSRAKMLIISACIIQLACTTGFMVQNFPFEHIYFNALVSHKNESLRKNFELDYWGLAYKQGLEHLVAAHPSGPITVGSFGLCEYLIRFNTQSLPEKDRNRIVVVPPEQADHVITNFRWHPEDYPYPRVEYSIKVLNSTILCVYENSKGKSQN